MKTFPTCSAAKNEVRHGIRLTLYLDINLKTPRKGWMCWMNDFKTSSYEMYTKTYYKYKNRKMVEKLGFCGFPTKGPFFPLFEHKTYFY